ncbi:hypothetical protein EJ03DRAFT_337775 [Teratosphaeria nubilosa]|uniref:Peptidase C19 ubiquitin carboxyl-terminal hydrolase domain-containing protein n=1 Tax=Teratosphaeria nubilosa TaxID=161662 RepID=A0A6G1L421_9PEZI|nr:hypothetical protein EJ03DRAFT_337775 [Teratosphaeria nubilosa]
MVNRGAECYKIALLQTLLHVPQMYQYLGNVHKRCDLDADKCVMCATQALWQIYWNDHRWPGSATRLRNAETSFTAALKASVPAGVSSGESGGIQGLLLSDEQAESYDFMNYLLNQLQFNHDSSKIPFDQMFGPGAQAQ